MVSLRTFRQQLPPVPTAALSHLLWLMLMLVALPATANETLEASASRNSIHENETLTLTVEGEMELELNLGSILSLRNLDLPEPDLGDLRDSFDILDQRQSYSLRSINGQHSAEVTWTFELAPRRSGTLTIPSLTFKNAQSQPIQIEVQPGESPRTEAEGEQAWVEAEVSKDEVFIQEQLVLTLRLYYQGSLIGGNLDEPGFDNAVVEPLGKQKQYTAHVGGNRYQVVERRYLVYPQRTGELEIEPQQFTGRQRNPATGALEFLRAQSERLVVEVLPPPDDFPGDRWVAAESLVLDEDWSSSPDSIQVGDSLTRDLTLRTLGLLETALPQLTVDYPENFRVYPEEPRSDTKLNASTVEATQTQTAVLMAVKPGSVTLPEIRLHWWDTLNDQARVATVPARTITIRPAPGATPAAPAPAQPSGDSQGRAGDAPDIDASSTNGTSSSLNVWLAILATFFALAWLVTLVMWWRKRPADRSAVVTTPTRAQQPAVDLTRLKRYATHGHTETLRLLPAWVRQTFNQPQVHTLQQVRDYFDDPALNDALDTLEQFHFGGEVVEWTRGKELAATLERLSQTPKGSPADDPALPPFRKL